MNLSPALTKSQPVIITVPSGQKGLLLNNQSSATIIIKSPIRETLNVLPGLALTSPVQEGEQLEFYFSGSLGTSPNIDISFSETTTNLAYIPIYNAAGSMQISITPSPAVVSLAYKTNWSPGTLYQGTVDIFQALTLFLYPNNTKIYVVLQWYGTSALQDLQSSEMWDIDLQNTFVWQFPVLSPYVVVSVYSGGGPATLTHAAVYGTYSPAPIPILQSRTSITEIYNQSIQPSGGSYSITLLPYKGAANIDLYNTLEMATLVTIIPQDAAGIIRGNCYHNNSPSGIIHDYLALPPRINILTIKNNGATTSAYSCSITAI